MTASDEQKLKRRRQFGLRLRELRLQRKLTQEQVADAAGLDRSFYVEVENGVHSTALDRVFDLADALEVDIKELFD